MSSVFSPVNLNKGNIKDGLGYVLSSLCRAPIAFCMCLLILLLSWSLYGALEGSNITSRVGLATAFLLCQVYTPVLLSSYMMFKVTNHLSWSLFWQNIKVTGFYRRVMIDSLVYTCVFLVFSLLLPIEEVNHANYAAPASGDDLAKKVIGALIFLVMISVSLAYWLDMLIGRMIVLRTGFSLAQADNYIKQTQALNPKLKHYSLLLVFLAVLLSIIIEVQLSSTWSVLLLHSAVMLVLLFWLYVLFGNTFPKKESVAKKVLKPVESML